MVNGTVEIGSPTAKTEQSVIAGLTKHHGSPESWSHERDRLTTKRPGRCSAMALQSGEGGRANDSAPQKFVQLVGCRDLKARAEPSLRPRPTSAKR